MWKIISNSLIWSTLFKRNFDATTWFCFSDCKTPEVTARFSWKIVLVRFTLKKLFYGTMVERVEQLFQFQFSLSQLGFFCLLCISLIYFLSAFLVQNGFRDRDELANQTYRIIVHFWVIFCTKKPKSKRLPIYPNLEKYFRDRDRLANYWNKI